MLTLLHLESSQTRCERFERHFSHRFSVHSATNCAAAMRQFAEHPSDALVSYCHLPDGHAFDLAASLREINPDLVVLVHGSPKLRKRRLPSRRVVDMYSPELMAPPMMEGLVWNAIVERHAPPANGKKQTGEAWPRLLTAEPMLEQVLPLVRACTGDADPICLARQLQKLLHTRHTSSTDTLPFVAIVEGDRTKREAMHKHFAGRLRLFFVVHPRDLLALHKRQSVSAIVFQEAGADAELIKRLRSLSELHIPMLAHGLGSTIPVDRQVNHTLNLSSLEVLLWEELTQADPRVLQAGQTASTAKSVIQTRSASLPDDEVARRSSWGDLLTAEASLTNLKRLFIKQISLGAESAENPDQHDALDHSLSELSWSELLKSDVSKASVTELFTREIRLFPAR